MSRWRDWLWLTTRQGVGAAGALALLDHFATPERAFYADAEEYDLVQGLSPRARAALRDKDMTPVDKILGECDRLGLQIMTLQDAQYPERLRQIPDPPLVLYIRGRLPRLDDEAAVAIVGAREATEYGVRTAGKLALELTRGGALVVTGMAEGIDAAAVRGALKGGGPVVSVVAGGLDVPFPPQHRFLYDDVAAVGALISEHPPGTPHHGYHFPVRNRILSGLSLGVVAVECRVQSGTMITIRRSLDQDRDVFAVPGPVDAPMSQGPLQLLRQGARPATCAEDILADYRPLYPAKLAPRPALEDRAVQQRLEDLPTPPPAPPEGPKRPQREWIPAHQQKTRFTDDELALLRALDEGERTADELVELTQIPARRVLSALTMLQVQGALAEGTGKRFAPLVELEKI